MDKEYYEQMKQTAAGVKACLQFHVRNEPKSKSAMSDVYRTIEGMGIVAVALADKERWDKPALLPQHVDALYDALTAVAVDAIIAATRVKHG